MSFLFKVRVDYEQFIEEANKFKLPLKFYTITLNHVTMYMMVPLGSSGLMYLLFCEQITDDQKLKDVIDELERNGFTYAESVEIPLP